MPCACHADDEQHPQGVSRRLMLAGGLAAGGLAVLPGIAGAATGEDGPISFGGAGSDPTSTTTTTTTLPPPDRPISSDFSFLPPRPANEVHTRPMMFPVLPDATLGKASWSDTYLAPRGGGRQHEGQDLMGAKLLKLLACVDGTIIELRYESSGNSLYLKGDDGWYYCYLHINNDDPGTDNGANQRKYAFPDGIVEGKRVLKGEHIAYLGDSGNAEASGAHCHFEIRMPNAKWYNAAAVNAKYSLNAAEPAKLRAKVPDAAFAPLPNARAFALQNAQDFFGSDPNAAWLDSAEQNLQGGVIGLEAFIKSLLSEPETVYRSAPTIRLYLGFFLRIPDYAGLEFWIRKVRLGVPLDQAANTFAASPEFTDTYGELGNEDYLFQIYNNIFGRDPDPGGADYWLRKLNAGAKRGWVMRQMCESPEYRWITHSRVRVIQVYMAMLRRAPDAAGYEYWTAKDASSPTGLDSFISGARNSGEYAARF